MTNAPYREAMDELVEVRIKVRELFAENQSLKSETSGTRQALENSQAENAELKAENAALRELLRRMQEASGKGVAHE